jgi:hypothetical protein
VSCLSEEGIDSQIGELCLLIHSAAVAHGSAVAWEHVNRLGEYDLSEEKFKDSVRIKPTKLTN